MNYHISKDRRFLTITADAGERANLVELGDSIHSDSTMCDVLEHITCNSELEWVRPEETGDLTDAPLLGIRYASSERKGEPGELQPIAERWGFEPYAVRSLLQDLRDKGEAVLSNAW